MLGLVSGVSAAGAADPPGNISLGSLPSSCVQEASAACEEWVMSRLDAARAELGLASYRVPADFVSLPAAKQIFILSNLDRVSNGATPIPGLNSALDSAALAGVDAEDDPRPPSEEAPWEGFASDWADAAPLESYFMWMYDDGYGGPNLDCSTPSAHGCWGHRRVILGEGISFPDGEVMGVASGTSRSGETGSALIISSHAGASTYYTWTDAQDEGAGASGGGEGGGGGGGESGGGKEQKESGGGKEQKESGGGKEQKESGGGSGGGGKEKKASGGSEEKSGGGGSVGGEKSGAGAGGGEEPGDEGTSPQACVSVAGYGGVRAGDREVTLVADQLSTTGRRGQRLEAWIRNPRWQLLRLTALEQSSCSAIAGGYEFRGHGTATIDGSGGYSVSFALAVTSSGSAVTIEVTRGQTQVYRLAQATMNGETSERISSELELRVRRHDLAGAHRRRARRGAERVAALRRADRIRDLKAARRRRHD
jgi:hypothetical protein